VYLYAFIRVDRRFHVPDGSHGPGDYLGEKKERRTSMVNRVMTEEEVFDDQETDVGGSGHGSDHSHEKPSDLEAAVTEPVAARH